MTYKILLTTAAAVFAISCSAAPDAGNANANAVNANANSALNTNTADEAANANTAPAATPAIGPTEAFIALSKASREKDVEAIKSRFSKATLVLFDQVAAEQGKTVDDILREPNGAPFPVLPDLGDEKIEGTTAELEIGDPQTGSINVIPFVIEDGEWKIAMDVYLRNMDEAAAAAAAKESKEK